MNIQDFFYKYKTIIAGFVSAIILAIVQVDASSGVQWKDFVLPVVLAATGFIGTQARGQWSTIVGIGGVMIYNLVQSKVNGTDYSFTAQDFQNLVLQLAVLYGFIAMPPVKSRTYEHDPVIKSAKEGEGETPVVPLNNLSNGA
jgi:uncharacterized membrane protein YagU involved in acid resistance